MLIFSIILLSCNPSKPSEMQIDSPASKKEWALAIHGGAGTILKKHMTPEKEKAYREILQQVLEKGKSILENGGDALTAVEECIKIMENSPLFNAGKGSVLTNDGKVENDASIMDGKTLNAGAVAGVTVIKNPISAAKAVMEHSPHVMLIGKGAETFCLQQGIDTVDNSYFITEQRKKQWEKIKNQSSTLLDHDAEQINKDKKFGTVGVVALDKNGNLAAGTSTGGMMNKQWGRVGDSPIIGAGTYADNSSCAVSCTGHGEYFIRLAIAHSISEHIKLLNLDLDSACNKVIHKDLQQLGGKGGVIAVDKYGNHYFSFNTEGMYRGFINSNGEKGVFIYKNE
ncbi:MAG: isoaspartyl peptidase/L-asparaginase [Bacteroidetes bacterium]|nr:MAG: isoaspartyl peptidase/L-asparaginase [Bacteroidota bacterium]